MSTEASERQVQQLHATRLLSLLRDKYKEHPKERHSKVTSIDLYPHHAICISPSVRDPSKLPLDGLEVMNCYPQNELLGILRWEEL